MIIKNRIAVLSAFAALLLPPGLVLAAGALRVHPDNPRYFTDGTSR